MAQRDGGTPSYSVTSAGVNPVEDLAHRMRMYFIAMSLRVVCVGSLFWVRGWWIVLPLIGSIVLPWFAVMVGNAVAHGGEQQPDAVEPAELTAAEAEPATAASELLVVDVDPVRRAAAPTTELGATPGESAERDPTNPARPE